jgi:ABC-type dipeptide/oligopeptide/nickel transport system permease component
MKTKLAAYITAAVLMGIAAMMLPLALQTAYPTSQFSPQSSTDEQQDQLRSAYGLSQPSITSSSLILIVGLIFAFAAYIIVKKQVNRPDVFSFPYKPF